MRLTAHFFGWAHYCRLLLKITESPHNFPHSFSPTLALFRKFQRVLEYSQLPNGT